MKRTKRRKKTKSLVYHSEISAAELDQIAAPFEKELIPSTPLTPSMRAQERRARAKRGRPVIGEGAEKVLVSLERGLLRETDSYAKRHKKNRSQVIVEALRAVLRAEEKRRAS